MSKKEFVIATGLVFIAVAILAVGIIGIAQPQIACTGIAVPAPENVTVGNSTIKVYNFPSGREYVLGIGQDETTYMVVSGGELFAYTGGKVVAVWVCDSRVEANKKLLQLQPPTSPPQN